MFVLPTEIKSIDERIRKVHSGISHFAQIYFKERMECVEALKLYVKFPENKEAIKVIYQELGPLIKKVLENKTAVFDGLKNYTIQEFIDTNQYLHDPSQSDRYIELNPKDELITVKVSDKNRWFEYIREEFEIYKHLFSSLPSKDTVNVFHNKFKITPDQAYDLYNLMITGDDKNERFINIQYSNFKNNDDPTQKAEKSFYEILSKPETELKKYSGQRIKFGCQNKFVAFILYWLEKKGKVEDAFTSIDKYGIFEVNGKSNRLILQGDLSTAKSNLSKIIAPTLKVEPKKVFDCIIDNNVDIEDEPDISSSPSDFEILEYLHKRLSIIFKKKTVKVVRPQ